MIANQRVIPVNSTTAVVLRSDINTFKGAVASTADATHFVGPSGLSTVDDFYNGIYGYFGHGPGRGRDFLVTDYVGGTLAFAITPAYITAPTAATTFVIGPSLPGAFSEIAFGGGAGIIYYSFTPGGALNASLRMSLGIGEMRTMDFWSAGRVDYIELVSSAATDTVIFEWL